MIELSGLRKYVAPTGRARLEADIKFVDMEISAPTETMYFEIDKNYSPILVDDTYDPFVLPALYVAMYNKTDLQIRGNMSKKFYKNLIWYAQTIMHDFSAELMPAKIFVDGFSPTVATGTLTGAGISCGVDSMSTLYDRFICEDDPDYRINALFFFNCGANGEFGTANSDYMAQARCQRSISVAGELDLPLVPVDSNIQQFNVTGIDQTYYYMSVYSSVLALQNAVRRYYVASANSSYNDIKANGPKFSHYDFTTFCESYFVPLIQTERTELIVDGCTNRRVDKIRKLADWQIAHKYLNVCCKHTKNMTNCGFCSKCLRTLLPLEIMGKLDAFVDIFDLDAYHRESLNYKAECVANADKDSLCRQMLDFAAEYDFPMPTRRDCYALGRQVVIFD